MGSEIYASRLQFVLKTQIYNIDIGKLEFKMSTMNDSPKVSPYANDGESFFSYYLDMTEDTTLLPVSDLSP